MNRILRSLLATVLIMGLARPLPAFASDNMPAAIKFKDIQVLDLKTAAQIALAENPTIAIAQARVEQARQLVNQARSAYWPRLDMAVSGSRVKLSETDYQSQSAMYQSIFGPGYSVEDPQAYYQAGLTASWILFDGFARKFSVAAASYGVRPARPGKYFHCQSR